MSRAARSAAGRGALAALAALAVAAPAAAHTDLDSTRPREGAVLDAPPRAVTITYAAPLGAARGARIDAGGRDVAGAPRLAAGDARRLVIPVRSGDAPAGAYRVTWTVAGADGHELGGTLAFRVRSGAGATPIHRVGDALLAAGRALSGSLD